MTQSDAVGSGIAVEYYPGDDVPLSGGIPSPVTFPVADGTALSGDNAHVYTDVNDDNTAEPQGEVRCPATRTAPTAADRHHEHGTELCSARVHLHLGHGQAQGSWKTNMNRSSRCSSILPQQLPRSPAGGADRLHAGGRQLRGRQRERHGRAATRCRDRPSTARTPTAGSPTATTSTTRTCPRRRTAPRRPCRCTCSAAAPCWPDEARRRTRATEADTLYHEYTHGLSNRLVVDADRQLDAEQPSRPARWARRGATSTRWTTWSRTAWRRTPPPR